MARTMPSLEEETSPATNCCRGNHYQSRSWPTFAVLAVGMLATAFALWHLGRGTTFFYDEWDFVMQRRAGGIDSLLRSHNGHLNLVSAVGFRALFRLVGLRHYGAFRAMVIVSHLICCLLLFVYTRKRVGDVLALIATTSLLAVGRAWEDLLWPFQTALILSVAAGVGALILLDRRTRTGDRAAVAALAFSLASFSFGIPVVAGVTVELGLRRHWSRLWIPLVPALAYGLWYVGYGGTDERLSRVGDVLPFTREGAEAAVAALCGVPAHRASLYVFLLVAVVVVGLMARRGVDRPRAALVVTTLVSFWVLTGLTRATTLPDSAGASRYLYIGVAYLLLLLVEGGRDCRVGPLAVMGLVAATTIAIHANIGVLRAGAAGLRDVSTNVKAELAAVEIAGPLAAADFQPDASRMPQVRAGSYLAATADLGSPVNVPRALGQAPDSARQTADTALVGLLKLRLEKSLPGRVDGACIPVGQTGPGNEVAVRDGALQISAGPAAREIRLRRFGPFTATAFGHLEARTSATVMIPRDRSAVPWEIRVSPPEADVCLARPGG